MICSICYLPVVVKVLQLTYITTFCLYLGNHSSFNYMYMGDQHKMKKICINKPMVLTIISLGITVVGLLNYVSTELAGNFQWLILPSKFFGVPDGLKNIIVTICDDGSVGWDGQFYYYISNDILGLSDTASHIDAPSYRYQRIGLPLIAYLVAHIMGYSIVSVEIFTLVYIVILTAATYYFAKYLNDNGNSVLWVLPWILSCGVQITLRHALPDGAADAFMIFAFILILKRKYILYSIFITLASLCREGNIAIAFIIFLLGVLGYIDKDKKYNINFSAILAIPGIIFITWYMYVTYHFGVAPFKQALGITQLFMTGFYDYLIIALNTDNTIELCGLIIYFMTIWITLYLALTRGMKNKLYWSIIPFTILLGSFGPTVMMHYSGYLKGITSLWIYVVIMSLDKSCSCCLNSKKIYKIGLIGFMCMVLITGLICTDNHAKGLWACKYGLPVSERDNTSIALNEFSSEIYVNEDKGAIWSDMPFEYVFCPSKRYTVLNVNILNKTNEVWHNLPNDNGANAIYVSYQWFKVGNMNNVIMEGIRTNIGKNIFPNEANSIDMFVALPQEVGQYILRISLLQEGVAWFYNKNTGYVDINYVIK